MADKDSTTPRVFLARHDLPLTSVGRLQVLNTSRVVVGTGNLIDPTKLARVFVSPRKRAQQTFGLLFDEKQAQALTDANKVTMTEDLAEWDYGNYEGLVTTEIRARRRNQGLDNERPWNIWKDGCENGEYERVSPSSANT
ncbi:MAG: hypothetical protein LQ346_000098 [Caloplaca aetnensis]|nr:MAG: hypothetical protein LQ346_000098 [Caloplaca aetnensis]